MRLIELVEFREVSPLDDGWILLETSSSMDESDFGMAARKHASPKGGVPTFNPEDDGFDHDSNPFGHQKRKFIHHVQAFYYWIVLAWLSKTTAK